MSIKIAFWNLGNLFDTEDNPISNDFEFTYANGWTEKIQKIKVQNLAKIVDAMFKNTGPDLLGICEVENEKTLQKLVDNIQVRNDLKVIKYKNSPDVRGIDCALIYSHKKFEPIKLDGLEPRSPNSHIVHNRYPTRDIFEVPLKVKSNEAELIVYINHWPSRRMGRYESEPLRVAAANHLGRLIDQRLKFTRQQLANMRDTKDNMKKIQKRWNRNILVMGDFNDEPFNRSILEELKASSGFDRLEENIKKSKHKTYLPDVVKYSKLQAPLFNCMWPVLATPDRGSYYFGSGMPTFNLLDQFIVSRGLYYGKSGLRMKRRTLPKSSVNAGNPTNETELNTVWAEVFDHDLMITSSKTRRPKNFTFEKKEGGEIKHNNGFSDHFPIVTMIETIRKCTSEE